MELLPAEIRLEILGHLFDDASVSVGAVIKNIYGTTIWKPKIYNQKLHLSILQTSKLLRREGFQVLLEQGLQFKVHHNNTCTFGVKVIEGLIDAMPQAFKDCISIIHQTLKATSLENYLSLFRRLELFSVNTGYIHEYTFRRLEVIIGPGPSCNPRAWPRKVVVQKISDLIDQGYADTAMISAHRAKYLEERTQSQGLMVPGISETLSKLYSGTFHGCPFTVVVQMPIRIGVRATSNTVEYNPYADPQRNFRIHHSFKLLDLEQRIIKRFAYDYDSLKIVACEKVDLNLDHIGIVQASESEDSEDDAHDAISSNPPMPPSYRLVAGLDLHIRT